MTVNAQSVTIVASGPVATLAGGGGAANLAATGGTSDWGGGGPLAGLARSPAVSGLLGQGSRLSLGMIGGIGVGVAAFGVGMNALSAYTAPIYGTETMLQAAPLAGRYIHPEDAAAMRQIAEMQGTRAAISSSAGLLSLIPGFGDVLEMGLRPLGRAIALEEARMESAPLRRRIRAITGLDVGGSDLGVRARAMEIMGSFGRDAARTAAGRSYTDLLGMGISESDILGALSGVRDTLNRPGFQGRRERLVAGGKLTGDDYETVRQAYAARGDLSIEANPAFWGDVVDARAAAEASAHRSRAERYRRLAVGHGPQTQRHYEGIASDEDRLAEAAELRAMRGVQAGEARRRFRGRGIQAQRYEVDQARFSLGGEAAAIEVQMGQATGAGYEALGETLHRSAQEQESLGFSIIAMSYLEPDPLRKWGLLNRGRSVLARAQAARQQATYTEIGQREQWLGVRAAQYGLETQRSLYGGTTQQAIGGIAGEAAVAARRGDVYREFATRPGLTEVQREEWRQRGREADFEASVLKPREAWSLWGRTEEARVGVQASYADLLMTRASLFGGPESGYKARMAGVAAIGQQREIVETQMQNPKLTEEERLRLQARLVDLIRQEVVAREDAVRSYYQAKQNVAESRAGIASANLGAAVSIGGTSQEFSSLGRGMVASRIGALRQAQQNLAEYERRVASGEVEEDNEFLMKLRERVAVEQQRVGQAILAHSSVPLGTAYRERRAQTDYQIEVLGTVPGTYGLIRGALMSRMGQIEEGASVIRRRMDEDRAAGKLTPESELNYRNQLRGLGREQASTYAQLAYGWESRLIGMALNTPGSFGIVEPLLSHRAAIGAGVLNPHMGSRGPMLPFFMRQAGILGSIAGATGTPEGYMATALTGVGARGDFAIPGGGVLNPPGGMNQNAQDMRQAIDGATIRIQLELPDGRWMDLPGTIRTNNSVDTSPAGLAENALQHRRMMQGQ
jgi:hypothetical protein